MARELDAPLEPGEDHDRRRPTGGRLGRLSLLALGVVFGDIGTSPLYAFRECFAGSGISPERPAVLGVLSLITWSLISVVSLKYLLYILRAHNRGEGGILALLALTMPERPFTGEPGERGSDGPASPRWRRMIVAAGLFGATLLYADGTITPAISVLSAVEGLEVATPALGPWVLPITVTILVGLFFFQSRGTERVGGAFGPVMALWFATLVALAIPSLVRHPDILAAVDPRHGAVFLLAHGATGYLVLASVFLVVTGSEALYADLGHFGVRPIRTGWFALVFPSLLLNYYGQGALLLGRPEALDAPFFSLAPTWASYPVVAIATVATVIASQAVISGAFSLTRQAIQLGYLPRMEIRHTSARRVGQVFVPAVNWGLLIVTVGLVLTFRRSTDLAGAYGLAVSSTMVITTVLAAIVAIEHWKWRPWVVLVLSGTLLAVDLAFFGANLSKLRDGGWVPLVMAGILFVVMTTWRRGADLLARYFHHVRTPLAEFVSQLEQDPPQRVPGTAVFLTAHVGGTPTALAHQLEHNRVLHERVVVLTLRAVRTPKCPPDEALTVRRLPLGFVLVEARYGFMENPRIHELLERLQRHGMEVSASDASFFVSREIVIPRRELGMPKWRAWLFAFMARNGRRAARALNLPHERVVELGVEVEL